MYDFFLKFYFEMSSNNIHKKKSFKKVKIVRYNECRNLNRSPGRYII